MKRPKTTAERGLGTGSGALQGIALPTAARQVDFAPAWLRRLHRAGYTAVAIQNDPFPAPDIDPANGREYADCLLFLYTLGSRPSGGRFRAHVRRCARAAHEAGLRFLLDCWEPTVTVAFGRTLPPAWRGMERGRRLPTRLCFGHPDAACWYWDNLRRVCETQPDLDGFILGREDNDGRLCDETCPRCGGRAVAERWGEFYRQFADTVASVRRPRELILYDWWWSRGDHETILAAVPGVRRVVTRFENNLTPPNHPRLRREERLIQDVTLSVDKPIPDSREILAVYRKLGRQAYPMIPFTGAMEAFFQPYILAPHWYARKLKALGREGCAGWMDYDCGGIDAGMTLDLLETAAASPRASAEAWVRRTLSRRYGAATARAVASAMRSFERAVELFPIDLFTRDARLLQAAGYVLGFCICTPLRPAEARAGLPDTAWPAGRWMGDPHNYLAPRSHAELLRVLPALVERQRAGLAALRAAPAPRAGRQGANFLYDLDLATAFTLMLESAWHFYAMADLIQACGTSSPPRPRRLAALTELTALEIATTRAYAALVRRHPEFFDNSNWDPYVCVRRIDARLPAGPACWARKIDLLEQLDWAREIRPGAKR